MVRRALWIAIIVAGLRMAAPASSVLAQADADAGSEADAGTDPRREQVIVKGVGVEVTVGEVEDALAQQGPLARTRYRTPDELKGLVNALVRSELLAAEAARRGYEKNAAVRQTVKEAAAQALVRVEVESKVTPQAVPMEDVRAYYEAHQGEFHREAMRRASHIALETPEEAARLLPEAKKADARGFAELARQHSKHAETKQQGGDLGYFAREKQNDGSEGDVHPALRHAAFELKQVGDTTAPVRVDALHSIVRLTGERPERHASVDDAAPSIRAKLWRERRQHALDELIVTLRARDKPQVFAERVHQISFDDMERRPSGFAPDPPPVAQGQDAAAGPKR